MATSPDSKVAKEEMTEEAMLAILRKKYRVEPLTSTPSRRKTVADSLAFSAPEHSFVHTSSTSIPKMPGFSGDDPPPKGDVSFQEWRFEVNCLINDHEISPSQLVQAMRRSLRGTARKMLVSLGEKASVDDILCKLDVMFGDVSSKGMVMQEFFNSSQNSTEGVTSFGCRLEGILLTAIENGHVHRNAKNDLLRHKFWTGLCSEKLKSQTRHKYDSIADFNTLLREIRQVEKEISLTTGSIKHAQHNPVTLVHQDAFEERLQSMEKKLDSKFQNQMESMEKRLHQTFDDKLTRIMSKLDTI